VYKTTNAGATWTNISYNLPNIPVNTVVLHKGSAKNVIYIGTDAGVYYTYDGATTWELFSNMLPNVIVSELEIHADSNKIFAATFGRGIWMSDLADVNVGVQKNPLSNINFKLYPNKNNGTFNIQASNLTVKTLNLSVINVLGREVYSEQVKLQGNLFTKSYDLKLLPGVYYFRVLSGKYSKVEKFLVE
jgi:Secretion system C-terminal sorting domain